MKENSYAIFFEKKIILFMKLILWRYEYGYQIMKLFTTCHEIDWKLKLNWLSLKWTWFMISMELVEPIAKLVPKLMKSSLPLREFVLPKEYVLHEFWA